MIFYFAPMEGITGYIYRNAYQTYFHQVEQYFSPFIVANQSDSLKTREINDILPEHNQNYRLIPQLLTNRAKDFIHTANKIKQLGYEEVNLNLGCPSGTVVAKQKGSGFLSLPKELDIFLDEIFTQSSLRISVKTRLGIDQPEEFYDLLEIFNKYPIKELIIHPRVQQDFYKNTPNYVLFREALTLSKNPVCYNGDICNVKDYETLLHDFPNLEKLMIGRGSIANPGLITEIKEHKELEKGLLKEFHDLIYTGYKSTLLSDRNVLFKMKDLWFYMIRLFPDHEKQAKKIKKSERCSDYDDAVSSLFRERELLTMEEKAQTTGT
ncbi:MAG TPA: tRNA-dihydrouridine synthase family protein [Bacillota bacterium]|nr:tRNA-dihydrouridine synthase family protein [Bacillota bacterium]